MSEVDIVKGLITDGALPRFAYLTETAQAQVAQVLVLGKHDPAVADALAMLPEHLTSLPTLLAAHGLEYDDAVLAALSSPQELDDQQLEQITGGIDPVTVGVITLGITTLGGVLIHLIDRHYDYKMATL